MNKRVLANVFALVIAFILVSGIGWYVVLKKRAQLAEPPSATPSKIHPNAQVLSKLPPSHNTFGINVFKTIAQEEGTKNIFISPSSIALALSMVYNGANGETKTAMQKTLQFQNLDIATINQESLALINILRNPDPKVELSVANSVWARKGVDVKKGFLDVVSNYFDAKVATLDFSKTSAAGAINSWVSKSTKGKITTIVSSPIPDEMVMYIINAVYFKGSWTTEFDKKLTEYRNFTTADGSSKKHPMMKRHGDMPYLETDDFQSVSLPYGENKRLSMYVFLPKNLDTFVQSLDANKWNGWMGQYQEAEGTILLPKFKVEYEKGLIPVLEKLGMGVAFTRSADFTGIGDDLIITKVKHKTYVDVNEEGTEAAAVTGVGLARTSVLPEEKSFYMEVNRPFFFAIRDDKTQEILFMGIIQDP